MKAKEIAELLNVSEKTIYDWTYRNRFPKPIKLGRAVRWKRTDIEEALAKNTIGRV